MSLLLDALKKAEIDKEGNKQSVDNNSHDVDMDLDLIEDVSEIRVGDSEKSVADLNYSENTEDKKNHVYERIKNNNQRDEDALRVLINKTNYIARNRRRINRLIISLLSVTLILTISIVYIIQLKVINSSDLIKLEAPIKEYDGQAESLKVNYLSKNLGQVKEIAQAADSSPENIKTSDIDTNEVRKKAKPVLVNKKNKINVVYEIKKDPVEVIILQAYEAFVNADYRESKSLYRKVLVQEPDNRDAILGVAAIAIKENNSDMARNSYKKLLYLNPKDTLAQAGLSGLKKNDYNNLDESDLKLMLREQPEAAHLHFALGLIYAREEKWSSAQSEFFSAWSKENKNSDYAYNLGVSLDHLKKKNEAAKFYEIAINLSENGKSNFDKNNAITRLAEIVDSK